MTEDEIEEWFAKGRAFNASCYGQHWEVRVFDLDNVDREGVGEGDTLPEALTEAVANYHRYLCGAV